MPNPVKDDTLIPRLQRWRRRLDLRANARKALPFGGGVLAALLALLLYRVLVPGPPQLTSADVAGAVASTLAAATPVPAPAAVVFQSIQPSLVLIQVDASRSSGRSVPGIGSGVVINDGGDILTSLHVVENAGEIALTFSDGTESPAELVAEMPENDIAVLRALQPPEPLVPAIMGNPNAMQIGDEAFAVGHPFGLVNSISAGVISGLDRSFQPGAGEPGLDDLIQIDAAVNPGNSGGPLLNRNGEVIGIVTGLVNPSLENEFIGVGFAVKITTAGSAVDAPPY